MSPRQLKTLIKKEYYTSMNERKKYNRKFDSAISKISFK